MALSAGGRGLLTDVFGWVCALALTIAAFVYFKDLKSFVFATAGIDLNTAASARTEPSPTDKPSRRAISTELSVGQNGHFYATSEVNGRNIEVMIDTGASMIALTYEDAERIGVAPPARDFTHAVQTANGVAKVAPVVLSRVAIGDVMVRNVNAVVIEQGKLRTTLLGNSFLSKLSRYEMRGGRLLLEE